MQFYVLCKEPGHGEEKIYVKFDIEPHVGNEIPLAEFQMKCTRGGSSHTYYKRDIRAEVGLEPVGGAILGGLLFLVDPIAGAAAAIAGYAAVLKTEQNKVRRFEDSQGR